MPYLDPTTQGRVQPLKPRTQALCLSGGGYRGLYTARILEHLQLLTNRPLRQHFSFVAGTSIGAVIGAALAAEVPPQRIRESIENIGPELFARKRLHAIRQMLWAPYKQDLLSATLTELFTEIGKQDLLEQSIADTPLPLIITATSASAHEPRILGGNNLSQSPHAPISVRDAILASAAAPTYFPAKIVGGEKLLDGGLIANAPDLIATGLLQRRFGATLTDCYILSIGTCAPTPEPEPARPDRAGRAGWVLRARNIIDVTIDSQEKLTIHMMEQLLKSQFVRIDSRATGSDAKAVSTLDVATEQTTRVLKKLANERFEELRGDPRLLAYFN